MNKTSTTCINIREKFGKHYRVEFDESHRGKSDDPSLQIIPCRRGYIYPHGGNLLAVATDNRTIGLRVAKVPGVQIVQDAADGINATFPVEAFAAVARLVGPRRKRQLTPEQRQAAAERLAKYAFSPAAQSARTAQNRLQTTSVDTLAV